MSHEDYLYKMSSNLDPFYGQVEYLSRSMMNRDNNPMSSIDGMLSDIKHDCEEILRLRFSNAPNKAQRIDSLLRDIVKLFQGVCYLRLRGSTYINSQDRLFFGIITPLNGSRLNYNVDRSDLWNYLFETIEKVAGAPGPIGAMELLGGNLNEVMDICEMYQRIIALRMNGR